MAPQAPQAASNPCMISLWPCLYPKTECLAAFLPLVCRGHAGHPLIRSAPATTGAASAPPAFFAHTVMRDCWIQVPVFWIMPSHILDTNSNNFAVCVNAKLCSQSCYLTLSLSTTCTCLQCLSNSRFDLICSAPLGQHVLESTLLLACPGVRHSSCGSPTHLTGALHAGNSSRHETCWCMCMGLMATHACLDISSLGWCFRRDWECNQRKKMH